MNICFVSDDFLPSRTGVGVSASTCACELARRGHKVVILTSRAPGQANSEIWEGVYIYRFRSLRTFGFYQALPLPFEIEKVLLENQINVIHTQYLSGMSYMALKLAQKMNIRTYYTHHMTVDHLTQPWPMKPLRPLLSYLIRKFVRQHEYLSAPSRRLANNLSKELKSPVNYISNPIAEQSLAHSVPFPETQNFTVLFVGRLNFEKNIDVLLKGFALAQKEHPTMRLCLAGAGSEEAHLKRLAQKLNITTSVHFLGWVPQSEVGSVYLGSDIFVLPSFIETQGLVVLEAMKAGKPVIISNQVVSAEELVIPGKTGFIFDAIKPEDLADRICYLFTHPELRQQMGEQAKQFVANQSFAVTKVIDRWEKAYSA